MNEEDFWHWLCWFVLLLVVVWIVSGPVPAW